MPAYFVFEQESPDGNLREFVFELHDGAKIAAARAIIANANSLKNRVQGRIITTRAPYNPGWSFHLDPDTIGFFELQVEVCDANATYIEEHLDEIGGSTLPNYFW
jgi:hypothetical protein